MSDLAEFDRLLLQQHACLIGVDEAGRGALAGPVVAAAVCVTRSFWDSHLFLSFGSRINDSKQLTAALRCRLFEAVRAAADAGTVVWASGIAQVQEIERLNILGATHLAMERALREVLHTVEHNQQLLADCSQLNEPAQNFKLILVDGLPLKSFPYPHRAITKGDATSMVVALASICAKVVRDRLMEQLALQYPQYQLQKNKGYGSRSHQAALAQWGFSPEHRTLFLRKLQAREQQTLLPL